ncbi:MAG TPA: hypothetical protein VFW40_01910, partial [Capsulimonadaceae bacterium]|nr:hypothetical protein [Capsulimonadaceae bacterium]
MNAQTATGPPTTSAFRLLLWLKWTLMWRGMRRDRMRLLGIIVMLVFFVPLSLGLAYLCFRVCSDHPALTPYVAIMALGLAYVIWLVTPLLGFPLNESYDPTRLFVYPVSHNTIFLAVVVSGLFDLTTILVLPVFLALLVAASPNLVAGIANFVLIALFLLQTMATAQAVMLALIGFLRSRRFRDITMVLLPLFGMAFYILQQTAIHRMDLFVQGFHDIIKSPIWGVLHWLPPGWAQTGMMAARSGNYGVAFFCLLLLGGVCAVMAFAAAYALRQLYLGERGPMVRARPTPSQPLRGYAAPPASGGGGSTGITLTTLSPPGAGGVAQAERSAGVGLPPALAAVIQKEWRYLWRDPAYKVAGINILYTLAIFGVMFYLNPGLRFLAAPGPTGAASGSFDVFLRGLISFRIVAVILLSSLALVFNIFGGESAAVTVLFSFPTPRRYFFVGKNLTHAVVILALCIIGVLGGCYLTHSMPSAPLGILEAVVALPVVLAAGNLISIRFPHRMVVRGQRWGRSGQVTLGGAGTGAGAGCGYAFIYSLCCLASFVAIMPAVLCAVWPILAG